MSNHHHHHHLFACSLSSSQSQNRNWLYDRTSLAACRRQAVGVVGVANSFVVVSQLNNKKNKTTSTKMMTTTTTNKKTTSIPCNRPRNFASGFHQCYHQSLTVRNHSSSPLSSSFSSVLMTREYCGDPTPELTVAASDQEILVRFHVHQMHRLVDTARSMTLQSAHNNTRTLSLPEWSFTPNGDVDDKIDDDEEKREVEENDDGDDDAVLFTAVTLFRRFYLSNSVLDFHPRKMAVACVLFASKLEDNRMEIGDLAHSTTLIHQSMVHKENNQHAPYYCLHQQELCSVSTHEIAQHEKFLMEGLNFEFRCYHPTASSIRIMAMDLTSFLRLNNDNSGCGARKNTIEYADDYYHYHSFDGDDEDDDDHRILLDSLQNSESSFSESSPRSALEYYYYYYYKNHCNYHSSDLLFGRSIRMEELVEQARKISEWALMDSDVPFLYTPSHITMAIMAIVLGDINEKGEIGRLLQAYLHYSASLLWDSTAANVNEDHHAQRVELTIGKVNGALAGLLICPYLYYRCHDGSAPIRFSTLKENQHQIHHHLQQQNQQQHHHLQQQKQQQQQQQQSKHSQTRQIRRTAPSRYPYLQIL